MKTPHEALTYALESYPEKLEIAPVETLLLETGRQNRKRPAYLKLAVPDEVVKALRGTRDQGDMVLLVRVPEEVLERSESRIVLPGEVKPGT